MKKTLICDKMRQLARFGHSEHFHRVTLRIKRKEIRELYVKAKRSEILQNLKVLVSL